MHGEDLAVKYIVLDSGSHVLSVEEKTGMNGKKAKFKIRQTIELQIKKDEAVSSFYNFNCTNNKNEYAYAVINKKVSKKNKFFSPERAWVVNEDITTLTQIKDPKMIKCKWFREGESKYPF